jgi:signal transduction histidine kinase
MRLPFRFRRRSSPTIAILVLTAGLAGVLTYQAWSAAHAHRTTAEGAIDDYAEFAAWEFSLSVKEDLYEALVYVFSPVNSKYPVATDAELPPPSILSAKAKAEKAVCMEKSPYFFRVDLPSTKLVINGEPPSTAMQRWIRDTIVADMKHYKHDWHHSTVTGNVDGRPCSIVYQVKWRKDGTAAAAYGFQMCLAAVEQWSFAKTMKSSRLLPPSLTHNLPNDTMMSVILSDKSGREVWRTKQQYGKAHSGSAEVPSFGLVTTVSLNPRYADAMVIGGLPRSNLPLLLGVLALTLGLVGVGVMQLYREDQLARLRGDFIASVSHELRTPLAQLRMFAETLLLGRVRSDEERQRSLEIVDQEARRLSHLVENILQFSRAERHAIKLARADETVAPHVRAALEVFDPIARARKARVVTTLDDSIRCAVDVGALRQVLLNLLDNAVKYGPVGQEVRVSLERSTDGRFARIMVDDQGPGVPENCRTQVWEPFYRLDRDASSAVAGSGIGLSVVRELATMHGGTATIENGPVGTGARFIVLLPLCAGNNGNGGRRA